MPKQHSRPVVGPLRRLTPEEISVASVETILDELARVLARDLARKHTAERQEAERRKAS